MERSAEAALRAVLEEAPRLGGRALELTGELTSVHVLLVQEHVVRADRQGLSERLSRAGRVAVRRDPQVGRLVEERGGFRARLLFRREACDGERAGVLSPILAARRREGEDRLAFEGGDQVFGAPVGAGESLHLREGAIASEGQRDGASDRLERLVDLTPIGLVPGELGVEQALERRVVRVLRARGQGARDQLGIEGGARVELEHQRGVERSPVRFARLDEEGERARAVTVLIRREDRLIDEGRSAVALARGVLGLGFVEPAEVGEAATALEDARQGEEGWPEGRVLVERFQVILHRGRIVARALVGHAHLVEENRPLRCVIRLCDLRAQGREPRLRGGLCVVRRRSIHGGLGCGHRDAAVRAIERERARAYHNRSGGDL